MFSKTKKISFIINGLLILALVLFYFEESSYAQTTRYIITLSAPKTLLGDGVTSATITAKITDLKKIPVPDVEVMFSIISGEGVFSPESATTDGDGNASTSLTSGNPGNLYVTVKIEGAKLRGKKVRIIKIKKAPQNLSLNLTLTADPTSIQADGKSTSTITALLRNSKNNPVIGATITFETDHGTITASDVTGSNGIATATLTSDDFNGDVTVTARHNSLSKTTLVKFVAAGLLKLALSLSTNTIPSDGTTTAVITATLTDSANNPISGKTITFSNALDMDGDGTISAGDTLDYATLSATSGATDSDGKVTGITISSSNEGSIVVEAEVEGIVDNEVLKVVAPTAVKGVEVTSADTKISVNGGTTTITATFKNITSGTATFTATLGYFTSPTVVPIDVAINASGIATATLTSGSKTGVAEVKVSTVVDAVTGERVEGSVFVKITSPTAASIELSASPNNIAVDTGISTITARVRDADGNPVAGKLVGFEIVNTPGGAGPNDGSQLSAAAAVTDDDGIATVNFLAGALETPTFNGVRIDAFLTDDTSITDTTFLTISGRPAFISIAFAEAPTQNADSSLSVPITALVSDIHGNPVADGTSVSFGVAITRLALAKVSATGDFTGSKILNSEDINQNGALDSEEDINNNGFIDFIEDVNGNGQLDSGEDLDGNGEINSSDTLKSVNVVVTRNVTTKDGVATASLLYGLGIMERYQVLVSAEAGGVVNSQYFVLPHTLREVVVEGTDKTKMIPTDQTAFIVTDSVNTATIAPAGPTDLAATVISSGRVSLFWTDNSSNEAGFELERSTTSGSGFATIADSTTLGANATTYIDSTAVVGTLYFYRIRAINSSGNSSYSNEASNSIPKILPPTNLIAIAGSSNQIVLIWTDNSDNETGFIIEKTAYQPPDFENEFKEIAKVGNDTTFYIDGQISPAITYIYRVKAFSETDESLYSNEISHELVVFAPSKLRATAFSSTQNNLTWQDNSNNETGFVIERSTSYGYGFTQIGTVNKDVTAYSDTTAVAGTTYYYRVKATSSGGDSGYSNVTSSTGTVINGPTGLSASNGSTTDSVDSISLSWADNSSNEVGFKVELKTTEAGPYTESLLVPANSTSITIINLTKAKTYCARIRAFNGSTVSDYSEEACAVAQ